MTLTLDEEKTLVRRFIKAIENSDYGPEPSWSNILSVQWDEEKDAREWQELVENPARLFEIFRQAGHPTIKDFPITPLTELTSEEYAGEAVAVQGKVVACSDVEPYPEILTFKCYTCDTEFVVYDGASTPKCDCDAPRVTLDIKKSKILDLQVVKIQDLTPSSTPARLTCYIVGKKQLRKVRPGDTVEALGMFKVIPSKEKGKLGLQKYYDTYCINNITGNDKQYLPTEQDITRFKTDIEQPQFWDMLVGSVAPHLAGLREVKEVIALAIASEDTETPLNAYFIGDPSVAKSQAIIYASKLSPNGTYISAAGAKWPALSAHAQKDEETGTWLIQPGALAKADRGMLVVDEFHCVDEDVAGMMNEALEQKTVSFAKAGQTATLPTRCAVLVASNSKFGSYRTDLDLNENMSFLNKAREAFITRFPIIFILTDVVNEENDRKIAKKVIEKNNDTVQQKYMDDWTDEKTGATYYGFKTLKKFFAYLRTVPMPKDSDAINQTVEDWYISLRLDKEDRFNKLIKARFLDKSIQIMKLHARILNKQSCTIEDFEYAVELLKKSMNATAFEPETGEIDANIINGNKPTVAIKKADEKEAQFWKAFETEKNSADGITRRIALIGNLVNSWKWDEPEARRFIDAMQRQGRILESAGQGRFTKA